MHKLSDKKLFLLDMDGTIYLDNMLFEGTMDFLTYVKEIGGRYIFLTNNSSKSVKKYMEKLSSLGIHTTPEDFLTSVHATIAHLQKKSYRKIYVFGTRSFYEQLYESGLPVTDKLEDGIDCLCMGFDTELNFHKLENACILLGKNVDYIATNPDWVCPTWYGFVPDCGSVSEMLFRATKRRPLFIGKPAPQMAELAMEKSGFSKEETVIVGDRLYTDIACGVNADICSVFLLSGEGTPEDLKANEIQPTFIFENIRQLYKELKSSL